MAKKKQNQQTNGAEADPKADQVKADEVKPDDVKARMRAALEAKNNRAKDVPHDGAPAKQKANGPEVIGGGPRMHRRKSG